MTVVEQPGSVAYRSTRRTGGQICDVDCQPGLVIPSPMPNSLEFFLVERYLLYAAKDGDLLSGRVFHKPYPLQSVTVGGVSEMLVQAAGIEPHVFTHALFSPGVDVEVFRLGR